MSEEITSLIAIRDELSKVIADAEDFYNSGNEIPTSILAGLYNAITWVKDLIDRLE